MCIKNKGGKFAANIFWSCNDNSAVEIEIEGILFILRRVINMRMILRGWSFAQTQ